MEFTESQSTMMSEAISVYARLLALPGFEATLRRRSADGKTPASLAKETGNRQLADFFTSKIDLEEQKVEFFKVQKTAVFQYFMGQCGSFVALFFQG